jgi:N-acetylglutamate synthase-like GNAT family acetyltransferase
VNYALSLAAERGFDYVYACTTQPRVVRFFQAHGFEVVEPTSIPAEKWNNYPSDRREGVTCLRRNLA